ncbi:Gag protein [Phytophthora palmivora]|uniref:Gag protein n=1 Tax=Phytophthora palmivora TaxID=4796 RepID=A0A2P4XSW3_9STRA|nr:Gag protein [Phytophthora palmivora]
MKPAQPKPLRLKVNLYEGKEGENLHFWVREVELAMEAALISTERLRVAFALSNLRGREKTWAYTREATTPGCFTTWAQLCQQLRAAFLPANYECRQRSRFLACKQGKRDLHECEYSLHLLPEHIKVTVHGWPEGGPIPHTVVPRACECGVAGSAKSARSLDPTSHQCPDTDERRGSSDDP